MHVEAEASCAPPRVPRLLQLFLQRADSTLFNLSLLTSDVWAVLIGVALFARWPHPLYFLALPLIVGGIALYHRAPSATAALLRPPGSDELLPDEERPSADAFSAILPSDAAGAGAASASPSECKQRLLPPLRSPADLGSQSEDASTPSPQQDNPRTPALPLSSAVGAAAARRAAGAGGERAATNNR